MKMKNTVVLRRDYLHYVKKYNRFEKRHKNVSAHMSPCFRYATLLREKISSKFAIFAENVTVIVSLRKLKHFLFEICRDVQVGDVATVGECRPLSKTVKFNTLKVSRAAGNKKSFKKF